ncbi:MAG: NAD(P)/FAD-dependent oxidoreductase [Candidatus Stahlbacteria bacterium]|nr:MAG: NAD(P)/FAD-dependent oxidoreductase [Candidatus Stahlbacteria bacterium]
MRNIIIIGSGMGGLVAGNLLAKKGHKVTIFESHVTPGGYTAGFWRKGFYFESGTLSFESSKAVFQIMKDIGVYDNIQFTKQYGRWVSADFDCITHSFSDLKKALLEAYPSEKERLTRYFAEIDKMCKAMLSMHKPGNVFEAIAFPFKLAKIMSIFKKYDKTTVSEFTAMFFDRDSKLYQLLKDIGYPDMSAAILGGAILSFLEDYWTVKTGMQSWADALAENFKSLGGELRLKSRVDKIITKNSAVVGVSSNGKDYKADYVISASDYKKTFLKLLDDKTLIPQQTKEKIEKASVSEGFFTVYLGLNLPQEKMKEYLKIPHVYYFSGNPNADIHNSNDENYFEKTAITLYSPSLMNAELAPEGKSSLMIQTMTPYKWMNNWGGGDRETYKRLKNRAKNALIEKACVVIPNLKKYIEFDDAATPLTYKRFTHNTDGATSAWSWNPRKKFHKTIMSTTVTTPVKNLYIGSCWAVQIGGVPGAIMAAQKCVKKIK